MLNKKFDRNTAHLIAIVFVMGLLILTAYLGTI